MSDTEGIIKTVVGGLVSIKVLETGMKLIDKQKMKVKNEGLLYGKKKKKIY